MKAINFFLLLALVTGTAEAAVCRSTGFFGGGKAYLICEDGRQFGPYENATACQVDEAFKNHCGEASNSKKDPSANGDWSACELEAIQAGSDCLSTCREEYGTRSKEHEKCVAQCDSDSTEALKACQK